MQNREYQLKKLAKYFSNNQLVPFIRIMTKEKRCIFEFIQPDFEERITSIKNWKRYIDLQLEHLPQIVCKEFGFITAVSEDGMVYALKTLCYSEEELGVVIYGGYCLSKKEVVQDEKGFLSAKEIKKEFQKISRRIDFLLASCDNLFLIIIDKLHKNFHRKYTLQELSDELQISCTHINRLFHKNAEMTFGQYYRKIKLEQARDLRKTTSLSKIEIMEKLGYSFSRSFLEGF